MSRFVKDNGVVFDAKTNLEWQANHSGSMTWHEAVAFAESLGDGWRLPTIEELESLLDRSKSQPASNFPGMNSDVYWSSSSYAGASSCAWDVSFYVGYVGGGGKSGARYVRCVRGGESSNSPAYQLLLHVWKGTRGGSWQVLNQSMRSALSLAITSGMEFHPDDFALIYKNFRGGYWFGEGPESLYSTAVEVKNVKACKAWEKYVGRKPFFIEGKRLHIRSQIAPGIIPEKTDSSWSHVTKFDDDGDGLNACVTEYNGTTTVVKKRIHLTRAEIAEIEKGIKDRAKTKKDAQLLECDVCGEKYRRGDKECACTKDLANCKCGKRKWIKYSSSRIVCHACWGEPGKGMVDEESD